MKLLFNTPVFSIAVWANTGLHPRKYKPTKRRAVAREVRKLTRMSGSSPKIAMKLPYNLESISHAPKSGGVYRVYSETEIRYIGASQNIQKRLGDHIIDSHNEGLMKFIETGDALVDWYQILYFAWMERFELVEFEDEFGSRPFYNIIDGGLPY